MDISSRITRAELRARISSAASANPLRRQGAPIRMKAILSCDMSKRTVKAYILTFRDPTNPDRQGEVFGRHAADETVRLFRAGLLRVKMRDNHKGSREDSQYGYIGVWNDLVIDDVGLLARGLVDESPEGDAALKKLCSGTYDSVSLGFYAMAEHLHPTAKTVKGDPVRVIDRSDIYEGSLTGSPVDTESRVLEVKSTGDSMVCTCGGGATAQTKGAELAEIIGEKLALILSEDETLTRDEILSVIADQAGIELSEAQAIADGTVDAPEAETLKAFADVLRVDLSELVDASEEDVDDAAEMSEEKAMDGEPVIAEETDAEEAEAVDADRVSLKATEELRAIAADLEGVASRIRRLADEGSEEDVTEITEEVFVEEKSIDADRLSSMLKTASLKLAALNLNA